MLENFKEKEKKMRDRLMEEINTSARDFEMMNLRKAIKALWDLMNVHGNQPSIAPRAHDSEAKNLQRIKHLLTEVSVKYHSYSVTLHLIEKIRSKQYYFVDDYIPQSLVVGLGHDTGKIPVVRESVTTGAHEHQQISASWLQRYLMEVPPLLAKKINDSILHHHTFTRDEFTNMLKEADHLARQEELVQLTGSREIPFVEWFDADEFYRRLMPHINYARGPLKWKACTFKGIIYSRPQFLYELLREMSHDLDAMDIRFMSDWYRNDALMSLVRHLRDMGMIPDHLDDNHYARAYDVSFQTEMHYKIALTPLHPPSYYPMLEIEKRKIGILELIRLVWPTRREFRGDSGWGSY